VTPWRKVSGIHGGGAATRRLRGGLVVAQISLTVVLLVGAGLIGRSVLHLLEEDPGYRTDGALVMDVWQPTEQTAGMRTELSAGDVRIAEYLGRLMSRLATIRAWNMSAVSIVSRSTPDR